MTSRRTVFTCWRRRSASSRFSSASAAFFIASAKSAAQGGLVILAGRMQAHRRILQPPGRWRLRWWRESFFASVFIIGSSCRVRRVTSRKRSTLEEISWPNFLKTFGTFFQKPKIIALLLFLLLYRLGEAQLVKMVAIVPARPARSGGLGWPTDNVGVIYGTVGVIAFHVRRSAGRICRGAARVEILAVADAAGDSSAGRGVHLARLRAAGKSVCDRRGRGRRTIRLRLRVHGVHALHDLHRARRTSRRRTTPSAPASWRWA